MIGTQKEVNLRKGCRFIPLKRDVCPIVKHKQQFIDKKCRDEFYAVCQKQSFTSMSERNSEEREQNLLIDGSNITAGTTDQGWLCQLLEDSQKNGIPGGL